MSILQDHSRRGGSRKKSHFQSLFNSTRKTVVSGRGEVSPSAGESSERNLQSAVRGRTRIIQLSVGGPGKNNGPGDASYLTHVI